MLEEGGSEAWRDRGRDAGGARGKAGHSPQPQFPSLVGGCNGATIVRALAAIQCVAYHYFCFCLQIHIFILSCA